jgi:hypothetical protein
LKNIYEVYVSFVPQRGQKFPLDDRPQAGQERAILYECLKNLKNGMKMIGKKKKNIPS